VSVLLSAADAFSDIAFTGLRLGIMNTTADQVVAFLLLLFLILPLAASVSAIWAAFRSPYLDTERMKELSAFYAFILLVALTNMELLRVMPWRANNTMHDGLPDKRLMLRIWLAVTLLEDLPQLAIQVTVLMVAGTDSLLGPLSIAFSVTAIVWRSLRKAIYLAPSSQSRVIELNQVTPTTIAETHSADDVPADKPGAPPTYVHQGFEMTAFDGSVPESPRDEPKSPRSLSIGQRSGSDL
jgi:hypothetical protein